MNARAAPPPVPVIGLTGSVAAGKTEALAAFGRMGAATLSTDAVVHELLGSPEVAARLAERWGDEVAPGGVVDRDRVGAIVFDSPEELRWLEETLHPLVSERVMAWRGSLPAEATLAVVEIPLLFEAGLDQAFDATVAVVADEETRALRAGDRGTERVAERSARQLSQDEKAARATHVLHNDGTKEELEAEVKRLLPGLMSGTRA